MSVLEHQWVIDMCEACEEMDSIKAVELLENTKGKRYSEKETELVTQIEEYVNQYDYDEAVSLLQQWVSDGGKQ